MIPGGITLLFTCAGAKAIRAATQGSYLRACYRGVRCNSLLCGASSQLFAILLSCDATICHRPSRLTKTWVYANSLRYCPGIVRALFSTLPMSTAVSPYNREEA